MNRKPKLKVIEMKLGREQAVGMMDFENNNILVDPRQKPYEYFNTMIHEFDSSHGSKLERIARNMVGQQNIKIFMDPQLQAGKAVIRL